MRKTNFAIIGAGRIGKRHAAVIQQCEHAKLVAICDAAFENDVKKSDFFGQIPCFSDLEMMLKSVENIDVVVIATPNGLHETHALAALHAGKHVVIEKPMALTKAGGERILHAALGRGKQVFCVMQNRYAAASVWLKKLVESQKLGQIFQLQINCFWNRDERYYFENGQRTWHGTELDGGVLFTQFSHFIDLIYWLFGDISHLQANFKNFNHPYLHSMEDAGIVTFSFSGGAMGCLHYSTAVSDKNFESSISIIAENGTVKVSGQYMERVEYFHLKNDDFPPPAPHAHEANANHQKIIENVVEVLGGTAQITTNALEGLKVVEIIEKIYQLK
jgi:predicted dehydrogenase